MGTRILVALVAMSVGVRAMDPARFFANPEVQALACGAFAVQAQSVGPLEDIESISVEHRKMLVAAIRTDEGLMGEVSGFGTLGWPRQRAVIERVMKLQCAVFGCAVPPLVVHDGEAGHGPAFFEFDPDRPGTGVVHLWPLALAEESSPHAALMFAIHETRHSWQFQLAFPGRHGCPAPTVGAAFAAGFRAQKALKGKLSFCDFCTMHHEHEAFTTGNYVVGALTGWTADTRGMGCWSSQFDGAGRPRIDLVALAREVGPEALLSAFNEREKGQFQEMR